MIQRALRGLWRWSPLVTAPVAALFILWIARTADRYGDFGVRFEPIQDGVHLHNTGHYEAKALARDLRLAVTRPREAAPSRIPAVRLFAPESALARLDERLPHSGREEVDASLLYPDGDVHDVSLRYKGDHFWHWAMRKKSLRVKTKRKHLFSGLRRFSLNAPKMPDMVAEVLSYEFADEFDLLRPRGGFVEVHLNGDYRGVHFINEHADEGLLRASARMPGDIWAADAVARDAWVGTDNHVFRAPGLWEKQAVNNHFDEGADRNLRELLETLAMEPGLARTERLRRIVDVAAFARFHAYRTVCQTQHFDRTHNHRLYYDPWRCRFEPIVWDPIGWQPFSLPRPGEDPHLALPTNELDHALFEDPVFLAAWQRALADWFRDEGPERLMERWDRLCDDIAPSVARDRCIGWQFHSVDEGQVDTQQWRVRGLMVQVAEWLREVAMIAPEVRVAPVPGGARVRVEGRGGFGRGLVLELPAGHGIDEAGLRAAVLRSTGPGGERITEVGGALRLDGGTLRLDHPIGPQFVLPPAGERRTPLLPCTPAPVTFDLLLPGAPTGGLRLASARVLGPAGDEIDAAISAALAEAPYRSAFTHGIARPAREPERWDGTVTVDRVVRLDADLVIAPGTTVRLAPGASVIVEGRVTAVGEEDRPIRFEPSGTEPWGVFALRGEDAAGSVLRHCHMTGGSGLLSPLEEFSAMLSIHSVPGVRVEDCHLEDNRLVDDMLHAVYSDVTLERCVFEDAHADAVDLDITTALVRDCRFLRPGNDGLDLMTATVAVLDSVCRDCGDKGMSIGEASRALVVRTTLADSVTGAEVKDTSVAAFVDCELRGNGTGLGAHVKNWRYGRGGQAFAHRTRITSNGVALEATKRSSIDLSNGVVFPEPEELPKRVRIHGAPLDIREPSPIERFPDEEAASPEAFRTLWAELLDAPMPGRAAR